MPLQIHFLRHGQTELSRENGFCGSTEVPLTADGEEMAREFALAYRSFPWKALFCSPRQRARATVAPLSEAIRVTPEFRDGLREIDYGKWEGKRVDDVKRTFHDDYIAWSADPAWYPPTGGEPAIEIATRALQVVEEIRGRFDSGNVLVVSHKATIRIVLCSLLGIDVGRFRYRLGCPVASVSVVEFGPHGPLLSALADRAHLSERLKTLPGT